MTATKRGRKPITDKKIQVSVYIRASYIDGFGGMEKIREKILNSLKLK